jgi:hypothetical protein
LNTTEPVGHLGIPRVHLQEISLGNDYGTRVFLRFHKLAGETPIGKDLLAQLQADSRAQALTDKMISTGSGALRFEIDRLVAWWLWRANEVGHQIANENLQMFLDSDSVPANDVLWLHGIGVSQSIRLQSDVTLVPIADMPPSSDKELFLQQAFSNFGWPAPKAALVRNISVSKVHSDKHLEQAQRSVLHDLALLMNALPGVWCAPAFQTSYGHPDLPFGPFAGRGGGSPIFDVVTRRMCTVSELPVEVLVRLFEAFHDTEGSKRIRTTRSLRRIQNAKGRMDDRESWLDLGIALEMVLLNAEHNGQELPGQLNLHFRLRGSWLVGQDYKERRRIYKTLGEIYSLRSQIAHNGFSDTLDKLEHEERRAMLADHVNLAERILRRLVIDGTPNDWPELFLSAATSH